MNSFDFTIVKFVNQFAQHWWVADRFFDVISQNHLVKGGVIVTLIWWLWFQEGERQSRSRAHILATFAGSLVAMALARGLALTLPFRSRPMHEEALGFVLPKGVPPLMLDGWSSFPSDNAVLFFTLSTGLLFVSRRAGIFALVYSTLFVALPRLYLGFHYPTDLLAGALIGAVIAVAANRILVGRPAMQATLAYSQANPGVFYAAMFLFSFQIADMFESFRHIGSAGFRVLRHAAG